jgi:hypothetical protein
MLTALLSRVHQVVLVDLFCQFRLQRIVADLMKAILVSGNSRAPLRIAFPATLAPRWMPGLFPEKPTGSG